MMSYLGAQLAHKIRGPQNRPCALDSAAFPAVPAFARQPSFVLLATGWYAIGLTGWQQALNQDRAGSAQ
jgi:hypothetical protein